MRSFNITKIIILVIPDSQLIDKKQRGYAVRHNIILWISKILNIDFEFVFFISIIIFVEHNMFTSFLNKLKKKYFNIIKDVSIVNSFI